MLVARYVNETRNSLSHHDKLSVFFFQSPASEANFNGALSKMFQPPEILIFIDLVHWALEALDIYTINIPANGIAGQMAKPSGQLPRSKEEKEVLEHFSGVVRHNE